MEIQLSVFYRKFVLRELEGLLNKVDVFVFHPLGERKKGNVARLLRLKTSAFALVRFPALGICECKYRKFFFISLI